MKTLPKIAFASLAFLAAVGCEQHDPAVTVPGYAEKQAAQQQGGASAESTPKAADQESHH